MQQVWRKRWRLTAWFALGATTLVLLVAAMYKKNHKPCKGVEVTFSSEGNNFFIEEKRVVGLLKANGLVIGKPVESIDLKVLEDALKKDKWIANSELFFDNNQTLQAVVEEKTPVARIFTAEGSSFYIDSACRRLPLSEKLSARIPMFTNFPSDRTMLSKPDSALLVSVKDLAMFVQADDFWKAQVAQIDITPDGFVMIPTVGNQVILLGEGGGFQQKFDRLFSFYKQVWTKVGFEKYEKIDVRFAGQVVATIKGTKPAIVDSGKVRQAYEKLVAEAKKPLGDSISVSVAETETANDAKAPAVRTKRADATTKRIRHVKQNIVKAAAKKEPVRVAVSNRQADDKRLPKAVMKKPITSLIEKTN